MLYWLVLSRIINIWFNTFRPRTNDIYANVFYSDGAPVMMTVIEIDRQLNCKKIYWRSCQYFKYKCNTHVLWWCIFFSSLRGRTLCTCCHTERVTRKLWFFDHFRGFRFCSFRWTSTGYFSRYVLTVTVVRDNYTTFITLSNTFQNYRSLPLANRIFYTHFCSRRNILPHFPFLKFCLFLNN